MMLTMTSTAAPAVIPSDPLDDLPADAVVAVAMSGGVDSSVAAARCVARGLRTIGITLAMWPRDDTRTRDRGCCSIDAVEDARRIAATLGIPHYSWNLESEFREAVIKDFEDEYAAGRTPNPCVRCNERIKFGALLHRARAAGATHVGTGHYARRGRRSTGWTLHRASARPKDQAYTLHRLTQDQLAHGVFPLGEVTEKQAVRNQALELGLVTAGKPESQDLCFVDTTVRVELERRLSGRFAAGEIRRVGDDEVVGHHRGIPFYTVGQRAGLGLEPGRPDAEPMYVVAVRPAENRVLVGPRSALERTEITAGNCSWIGPPPAAGDVVEVQVRAHGQPSSATVAAVTGHAGTIRVGFDEPVIQLSPGQPLVVFRGDEVLGGGIIAPDV